jgi:hypothetical protein
MSNEEEDRVLRWAKRPKARQTYMLLMCCQPVATRSSSPKRPTLFFLHSRAGLRLGGGCGRCAQVCAGCRHRRFQMLKSPLFTDFVFFYMLKWPLCTHFLSFYSAPKSSIHSLSIGLYALTLYLSICSKVIYALTFYSKYMSGH